MNLQVIIAVVSKTDIIQKIPKYFKFVKKIYLLFIYLFITKFLSTYIHIQNTHTYATGIGLRLGLSLPSPVGITITIHCTNQYII